MLANFNWFGSSIAAMGDLNQDGIVDMAVGAWGTSDGGTGRGAVWMLNVRAPLPAVRFDVDPALVPSGWELATETHTVEGIVYDIADARVLHDNRSVFLSQTGCASALARLPLGYIEGNITVDIDYASTRSGTEAEELHFILMADSQLIIDLQADFPRSRDIVRLSAIGLDGSR